MTDYVPKTRGEDGSGRLADRIVEAVAEVRSEPSGGEIDRPLRQLTEAANDVLGMFSADWSELPHVNAVYEDIRGQFTKSLQANPQAFLQGILPDDRSRVETAMDRLTDGESVDIEYRVNADEAYQRWVWVQGEPIVDQIADVHGWNVTVTESVDGGAQFEITGVEFDG